MRETVRIKRDGLAVLFALFALSTLLAYDARAQARRNNQAPARCRDYQLSLKRVTEDAAMGGDRSIYYAFTNKSSSPCTLEGYPRFEVLNSAGRLIRGGRAREGLTVLDDEAKAPPRLLTIEPGKTAAFLVYYNSGGAGRIKQCPTYRRVRITPPGTTRGFVLRETLQLCGELQVSPVGSRAAKAP